MLRLFRDQRNSHLFLYFGWAKRSTTCPMMRKVRKTNSARDSKSNYVEIVSEKRVIFQKDVDAVVHFAKVSRAWVLRMK